jgi:hypothetical protein
LGVYLKLSHKVTSGNVLRLGRFVWSNVGLIIEVTFKVNM